MRRIKSLLELRDSTDFEIHVNEVRKKETKIEVGSHPFNLSHLAEYSLRNDISEALKDNKFSDFEDIVFQMNLTKVNWKKFQT